MLLKHASIPFDVVPNFLAKFFLSGKIGRRDTVIYNAGGKLSVKKAQSF